MAEKKSSTSKTGQKPSLPWWRGATIYQIYPRSFRDSNGDGVGDLRGCIEGLDHVASLGVDAVWLSPFFTSPMDDFGYDVADYCDVDPLFGSLRDFDDLIDTAHRLKLKVIIDQVYSHSSDQHIWFQESRADQTNSRANWYVWANAKPDGAPPNNWQSVFGGAAWEWDSRRRQYYLHNFLPSQPDLNLHNKDVQAATLDVARFWLERGVDGFRLDAINFAMHDPKLRDNPPVKKHYRPPTRTYEFQDHRYNQSQPEIVRFLERIRTVTDECGGAFTVAEIGGFDAFGEMKSFTQGDQRLNSAYSFEYLYANKLTADLIRNVSAAWSENDGWPSWAFSNHDAPRAVSRWSDNVTPEDYAKFLILLLASLRGNIFVYQGEELGLEQADVPFDRLQDPEAINNWPETLGRDGARTPMPWNADKPFAGFSTTEPWLPIDQNHTRCATDRQEQDPNSVLHFTRHVLRLRKQFPTLRLGKMRFLPSTDNIAAFIRTYEGAEILCAFNPSQALQKFSPPNADQWRIVALANMSLDIGGDIPDRLDPATGYIAQRV